MSPSVEVIEALWCPLACAGRTLYQCLTTCYQRPFLETAKPLLHAISHQLPAPSHLSSSCMWVTKSSGSGAVDAAPLVHARTTASGGCLQQPVMITPATTYGCPERTGARGAMGEEMPKSFSKNRGDETLRCKSFTQGTWLDSRWRSLLVQCTAIAAAPEAMS